MRDGVARRKGGALAGSVVTMPEAIRGLHGLGASFVEAVAAATAVPARAARRDDVGTLRVGGPADIVVLDDRLEVRAVYVDGRDRVAA